MKTDSGRYAQKPKGVNFVVFERKFYFPRKLTFSVWEETIRNLGKFHFLGCGSAISVSKLFVRPGQ